MGTRKLRKNLKKWFAVVTAAVLTLTAVNVSGFTGLFAESESPITIETTQTVNDDPATATVAINATAKEGYSVSSITFNNETIEGEEGTFTVFANGEYQVAVKYTTEGEIETTASPETSLEPTASAEASEEPIDEEFGISSLEETAPVATEEATPVVTEEVTPETTEEVIPEATEEVIPEVTEETVPAEQSEEEPEAEVTPETAFNFFTAVYAEETTPEATEETATPTTTEETYTETITVEGLVEEGTFVSEEETEEMLDNLIAVLGESVTVTKNEEKSTELGYNVYDVVAINPSDELAVSVEGTYTHGFTAGSKEETTGWYIAIPGLDPIQWAFSFSDATEGNHDEEARESGTELISNTTISNLKVQNLTLGCQVESLPGTGHDISEFTKSCPVNSILDADSHGTGSRIVVSFDFSVDVGVGNSINVGDTITIPFSGVSSVSSAPVELRDANNTVIGTWEVVGGNIVITITEAPTAGYLVSGSISTPEYRQGITTTTIPNDYRVGQCSVGNQTISAVWARTLIGTTNTMYTNQGFAKNANSSSSSDVAWAVSVDNGISGFVNSNGVVNPNSYHDVFFEDKFPAGTENVAIGNISTTVYGTNDSYVMYTGGRSDSITSYMTEVVQSGEDYNTFKALITPLKYGIYTDAGTGEITVMVNFGSMDTGLTYDQVYPMGVGTKLQSGGTAYSGTMAPTTVSYLDDLYNGKPLQVYNIGIGSRYTSVIASTPISNTALFTHDGTITPATGNGTLTPGAGLLTAPDPGSVKLVKSNNYSQLLDGATFKLQWLNGSTWTDVSVSAGDVTTGTGSGTSLQTASGQLIVKGLVDGQSYRFVETATPSSYKALNATNYPSTYDATAGGVVSDAFTANSTSGSVVTMQNLLDEVDYKVEHWTGPADGSAYTKNSEETKTKVPGSLADANPKTITGYLINPSLTTYEDSGHTTPQTAPLPVSSSLVVKLYYNPITYTIKYNGNAPAGCSVTGTMADQTGIAYDENVTLTTNTYACAGYTFGGWNSAANGTGTSYTDGQANVKNLSSINNGTATLYAKWTARTNMPYTVEYYKLNSGGTPGTVGDYTKVSGDDYSGTNGTTGGTVTPPSGYATKYTNWTVNTALTGTSPSATISCSGSAPVIKVYYDPDSTTYSVHYFQLNLGGTAGTVADYTEVTADAETGLTGLVGATASKTGYSTKYSGFTPNTTLTGTASISLSSTASSNVINIYYDRSVYSVSYSYTGTVPSGAPAVPSTATNQQYGATYTVAAKPTLTGYTFDGWKNGSTTVTSLTIPASNVSLTGSWTPASGVAYTVEHYQQNVTGSGYTKVTADTENKTGTTGGAAVATAKTYTGFTNDSTATTYEDGANAASTTVLTIAADGSLVVKLYYDRNTHDITYTSSIPAGCSATLPAAENGVLYEASKTVATDLSCAGYTFSGWTTSDATVTSGAFNMPDNDVTFTGTWTVIPTPTPNPATPNPRTCQDDGYPAGYTWNGTACVCTSTVCQVTPTPSATPRPTASPSASPNPSASPSTSPSTSPSPDVTSTPTVETSASPSPKASATPDTTKYTLVDEELNIYKDDNGNLYVYDPSYGYKPYQWALVNLIAALASVLLGIVLVVSKSNKEEDEDDDQAKRYDSKGNEIPNYFKRNKVWKIVGVLAAIVAVVIFILTENITFPMRWVDKYTLIMIVIALVSLVTFFLGRKWSEDTDREDDEANA